MQSDSVGEKNTRVLFLLFIIAMALANIEHKYKGWAYVCQLPLSKLPIWSVGLHPQAGNSMCAPWLTQGLKTPQATPLPKSKPKEVGPRTRGDLDFYPLAEGGRGAAIWEVLHCSKTKFCVDPDPDDPDTKAGWPCAKGWRWTLLCEEPDFVHIWQRGSHGEDFQVNFRSLTIPPYVLKLINDLDGLSNDGLGGRTTPAAVEVHLHHLSGEFRKQGLQIAFGRKKIENAMSYCRLKIRHSATTMADAVDRVLKLPSMAPYIAYPGPDDLGVVRSIQEHKPFVIVFMAPLSSTIASTCRREIVGLDSIYKWSKHGFPAWALVAGDERGHAWPLALAVGLSGSWRIIHRFLDVIKKKLDESLGEDWQPIVNIDKDEAERKALEAIGLPYILCDFHVQKLW
jgi:hypothetical protein